MSDPRMPTNRSPERYLQQLLGPEPLELVESLLTRSRLPDGRFEAHEFGRNQHSSASGGGLLIGLAGIPTVPDRLLHPVVRAVEELVGEDGMIRGHDAHLDAPPTTWGQAQILLGLLIRPHLTDPLGAKVRALADRLIEVQDPSTGAWPLRPGDEPRALFAFYPALSLTRLSTLNPVGNASIRSALLRSREYLTETIEEDRDSPEEQLLALRALEVLSRLRLAEYDDPARLAELRMTVLDRLWPAGAVMRVQNRPVVVYPQPTWHAMIWKPLLYLAVRGASPLAPLPVRLGYELVTTFDPAVKAWHGPTRPAGPGVSWASALALLATYRLSQDLIKASIDLSDWLQRCRDLETQTYDFDVAISFSGVDREIAVEISERIKSAGYRVFYDRDYQHVLLGEDLAQYLQDTYFRRSRFVVAVISKAFVASKWAGNWEWKAVLARMQAQKGAYLLPYIVENVELFGLNPTLGYVDGAQFNPEQFADLVVRKLRTGRRHDE
ncbi:TIR domain-containing protein [Micromonospora sp. NPDC049836]|uniref:TIR domain-containing protein n=1 Tax=Micromonospora sp. NPDC049836 TaxID=3364274 RepID=UPI00378A5564